MSTLARDGWIHGSPAAWSGAARWGAACALAALQLGVWIAVQTRDSRVLAYPDAFEYAQMGRLLADGHGFTSQQSFPFVLAWLEDEGLSTDPPWPNVWRFPLPVVLRAAAFRAFGANDLSALLPGALFGAATAALIFLLGNRLYGPLAGIVAALLWTVGPTQLHYATSGLSESGASFFIALCSLLLLRALAARRGERTRWMGVLGLAIGLAGLQRSNLLILAPLAGLLVALRGAPFALSLAALSGGVVALQSPWWLRNALHYGSPFLSLTSERGLIRLATGRDPFPLLEQASPLGLLADQPSRLLDGFSPSWLADNAFVLLGPEWFGLLPALVVGAFAARRSPQRDAWWLVLGGLCATIFMFSAMYPTVRRLHWPYSAPALALVVGGLIGLWRHFAAGQRRWIPWAAAALVAAATAHLVATPLHSLPAPYPAIARGLPELRSDRPLASNLSAPLAWRARRASIRFGGDPDQLAQLDRRFGPLAAVVLNGARAEAFATALPASPLAGVFEEVESSGHARVWLRDARRE